MNPLRNWCFTSYKQPFDMPSHDDISYCVYQIEKCPETGRLHAQGYLELSKAKRMSGVKKIFDDNTIHLEPRKATREAARAYCMKEESRVDGPFEFGTFEQKRGERNDINNFIETMNKDGLVNAALENPSVYIKYHKGVNAFNNLISRSKELRNIKVHVLYGRAGSGKTKRVYDSTNGEYFTPIVTKEKVWFDGYMGESNILLDDFDGKIDYRYLLRILDRYPLNLEVKGDHCWAKWTTVWITSNEPPQNWYNLTPVELEPLLRRLTSVEEVCRM